MLLSEIESVVGGAGRRPPPEGGRGIQLFVADAGHTKWRRWLKR
jgi:hypothetical protein